ncbi:hypothetical protein [Streptomyces lonarensis]|uniref:Secreted protein n=1 Tax=Streptomyces lonarensis TaxID=700599 RepID=A0A7X6D2B3_9ACTN|nr:hypothetical protein [Streptomyces lonarensis]NJQ06906.1 hypothetical protein [Streptomyces lonarensis]
METRESKTRSGLVALTLGVVLSLTLVGCSGGGDPESSDANDSASPTETGEGEPDEGQVDDNDGPQTLAQVTGERDITLTVTRAVREEGGFLTVEGTIRNGGGSGWSDAAWAGQEQELASNSFSMAGASLTAKSEGKKYLILRDTSGRCLCTRFDLNIAAGETVDWFAQFPAPAPETSQVDLQIGKLPPATFEIR